MAAGILSTAAQVEGQAALSGVLLALAVVSFLALVASDLWRAGRRRRSILSSKSDPHFALVLFTWVAACGVLGDRLAGLWPAAPLVFGVLAITGWVAAAAASVNLVLGQSGGWAARSIRGSWLLAVVATQSLSILAGSVARQLGGGAILDVGVGLWALGLTLYVGLIALILRRLARHEVRASGMTPDYWITMGALAISTVASTVDGPLTAGLAVATWLGGAAWVPYLCVAELVGVRWRGTSLTYDPLRWSTVFPLGMFSLATFELGRTIGWPMFGPIGLLFFWAGLILAAVNTAGAVRAVAHANRSHC
ncbi:hypothetical protein EPN29_00625 [bacterium]|nr:MAG: hypothetical protein EPN29_00625 [bacterium]